MIELDVVVGVGFGPLIVEEEDDVTKLAVVKGADNIFSNILLVL